MKKVLLFFLVLLSFASSIAQNQHGYVKTKGRLGSDGIVIKGTRLTGATVTVKGRNAVLSGNNGNFSLTIPGNTYYLQNVQKQGYIVTDPDVLSRQYSYSKNPLILVLETQEQRTDDKLLVERKIRRNLQRQLQQREEEIEALKEENKITKQEYQEQLKRLYDEQDSNEKLISDMTERYAKIDYDQVDKFNTLISKYILDGELTKADSLLRTKGDINSRTSELRQLQNQNAKDEVELNKRKKKLDKNKLLAERELADLAQDCYSRFEIFSMQHQNDSAAYYIQLRSKLDTTNVQWSLEAGKFLEDYLADYEMSLTYYSSSLRQALAKQIIKEGEIALCNYHIGYLQYLQGKYPEAMDYYMKSIFILRELPNQALDLANIYHSIGQVYDKEGKYLDGMEYFENALNIRKSILGDNDPMVAYSYNDIGVCLQNQGLYEKALECQKKALSIRRSVFGDVHYYIALSLNNVGTVLYLQGKKKEAIEYLEKALNMNITLFGQKHPYTSVCYNNLGTMASSMGDQEKALDYHEKALEIRKKIYQDNHVDIAISLSNIANVYFYNKEYNKSIKYQNESLNIRKKIFGENHPDVALCYNNIAMVYFKLREYQLAIENFEKALVIFTNTLPSNHPYINFVKKNIEDSKQLLEFRDDREKKIML